MIITKKLYALVFITVGVLHTIHAQENLHNAHLLGAAQEGNVKKVAELLAQPSTDVNSKDNDSRSALELAVMHGHIEIVNLLLKAGANPNTQDKWENTALMEAALRCNQDICRLLLAAGALLHLQNSDGDTALMCATKDVGVMGLLLEAGADHSVQNNDKDTALTKATLRRHTQAVRILLKNDADPRIQNNAGNTSLVSATRLGSAAIAQLNINFGAEIPISIANHRCITANDPPQQRLEKIYR